jgi:hypothetical protein
MAGTATQDLWNRCHPLPRLSERKDVQDWAVASLSMPQPLIEETYPMNSVTTNGPVFCEKDIPFRHDPLLPKITPPHSFHPSVDRFEKRLAPVTNPYRYKMTHKTPYLPACQKKKQRRFD